MKYCIQIVNFDFVAGVLNTAYGILETALILLYSEKGLFGMVDTITRNDYTLFR